MSKKKTAKKTRSKGGKKAKLWDVVFCGETARMITCPHRCRLAVVKNEGARKGFLVLRCSDGALVAWARLKGHATQAMEELEEPEELDLSESRVWAVRNTLAAM